MKLTFAYYKNNSYHRTPQPKFNPPLSEPEELPNNGFPGGLRGLLIAVISL